MPLALCPFPFFVLSLLFPFFSFVFSSSFDCSFEPGPSNAKGFCAWRPKNGQSALLWHNGDAVIVDAANSLVHSAGGVVNRFAYAQGHFDSPTEGSLRSPLVVDRLEEPGELTLSYWKASASPSLDICVEEDELEPLRCVDTIQGPGQKRWVRRAVELPKARKAFRVVLRARNLLSAEDIVGVDDVRLLTSAQTQGVNNGISEGDTAPKNPFDGLDDEQMEQAQKQQQRKGTDKLAQTKTGEEQQHKQQKSPIRPQIRLSPSFAQSMRPSAHANDQSLDPPMPSTDRLSLLPLHSAVPPKLLAGSAQKASEATHCRAVSCSFLDGNCLWQLGPGWHNNSEGSLSIQSPAQFSQLSSALFKPALTSSVDFDLWMSENTEMSVVEKAIGKEDEGTDFLLFTRHGATDGGWHRFRVPLRPSFSPVRLIFRIKIEERMLQIHADSDFVSISNLKLVNGDGDEIGCETVGEEEAAKLLKTFPALEAMPGPSPLALNLPYDADDGFGMHQPAPLQLPSQFPLPPPLLVVPSPSFPSQFVVPSLSPPMGPPSTPFNPFSPMFEGILPIVPLRDNPPRLTALMDAPIQQRERFRQQLMAPMTTKGMGFLAEEDRVTAAQEPQGLLPIGTKTADEGTAQNPSDESVEDDGKRRHQLKRVIRPESHVREISTNNAPLLVLPKGRKWGRKGQMNIKNAEDGEEGKGWPMMEMGIREQREKGKSERGDEFRRRH
ncbi:hypothetical protein niasHT_009446 [Heterodera trifolii]|uniref:MAM domain-containing protein n=1 Tax=Heterodera trifolii TaxID=157864 RepID=A0ABD2MEG0_9BILA